MGINKKILVVDDDEAIQDVLQMIFEEFGYEIDLHTNGENVLKDNYQLPDLFILDKQLPGVDGLDICRHIKSQERSKHIPVIILSASPQTDKPAMAAGADLFLEKPFKRKDLLEIVNRLMQ